MYTYYLPTYACYVYVRSYACHVVRRFCLVLSCGLVVLEVTDGVYSCLFFWAFLELSLTVPIVNTMAFLFTVLGEWYVEGKVISRGKGIVHYTTYTCTWQMQRISPNAFFPLYSTSLAKLH